MTKGESSAAKRTLSPRRVVLLASVAGLGAVLLLGGSGYQPNHLPWAASARAAEAAQSQAGFADLVAKVKPAVISIRVKIDEAAKPASMNESANGNGAPVPQGSPLDRFFQQFGNPSPQNGNGGPHLKRMITGEGSGFFISPDGYAVTNYHVVDHAKSVQVKTDDGTTYTAKVIGADQKTDVALIKVDGKNDFPYVKFADQEPRIGNWVVAVGNPFGLGGTVTAGIVSAVGRNIGGGVYDDYIQIDAPINKGNSGGPAFNMDGDVIGVNTAIFSPSGGSVGIGFDIPANTVKMIVAQLKDKGSVTRAWMGVQIQPVTVEIADSLGMKKAEGALVDAPQPNSPAAKAGVLAGDVITAVNGRPVKDSGDLARNIAMMAPGSSVKLDILRKGETKTIELTLGQMKPEQDAKAGSSQEQPANVVPTLGLTLAPADEVQSSGNNGVVVTAVDPNGAAADHGIQTGDVILDISGKAVTNVADVRKALAEAQAHGKHSVLMRMKTGDATKFVALPLANG